jgi:hypothetical protein
MCIYYNVLGMCICMCMQMKMDTIVEEANKTHLAPWMAIRKEHGVANTPLSPFLHKQLLQNNHLNVDGSAIEAAGFKYAVPELTQEGLKDEITQAVVQGIFPVRGIIIWYTITCICIHHCLLLQPVIPGMERSAGGAGTR